MREKEIWKDVNGFEGIYQVSNHGRLKSFKRITKGRILSNNNKTGGYLSVVLRQSLKIKSTRMHRIVAEHFVPNPENKPQVNHKDLNKQNNYFENLEWCTQKENNDHANVHKPWKNDGMINYNKNIRPIPVIQYELSGIQIKEFKNGKEASLETGVCHRNILQVCNGSQNRKQAGGYMWKFKDKL